MADEKVPQKDIIAVFKRLKSAGENKVSRINNLWLSFWNLVKS